MWLSSITNKKIGFFCLDKKKEKCNCGISDYSDKAIVGSRTVLWLKKIICAEKNSTEITFSQSSEVLEQILSWCWSDADSSWMLRSRDNYQSVWFRDGFWIQRNSLKLNSWNEILLRTKWFKYYLYCVTLQFCLWKVNVVKRLMDPATLF